MRRVSCGALAGLALLCGAVPLLAQNGPGQQANNIPYGTRSGEFLLLPVGGRGTALGNAYDPLADDVSAMYWNPAGLSLIKSSGAEVSRMNYIADTNFTWAGVALPFGGGERAFGVSLGVFGFSNQPEYTIDQPEGTGRTYSVSDTYLGLTYSQQFTDRFSFGLTGKYISETLAGAGASTVAADFGANYHAQIAGRTIRGSFVVMNVGGTLKHSGPALDSALTGGSSAAVELRTKGFDLPSSFRVGIAYDLRSTAGSRLTALGEFIQPMAADVTGAVGAEYALTHIAGGPFDAALRGGWNLQTDKNLNVAGSSMNGAQNAGLAFGVGIGYAFSKTSDLGVDYAWRDSGLLGAESQVSLSLHW